MFNESEFAAIVAVHSDTLRLHIARQGIAAHDIEDVLQKTWLSFWDNRSTYDPAKGSIITFLFTIAHRRSVDHIRLTSCRFTTQDPHHQVTRTTSFEGETFEEPMVETLPDEKSVSPEEIDLLARVQSYFDSLPADVSLTLRLHYFDGYSVGEIASICHIHHSSVTGRIQRGIATLRTLLCQH